MSWNCQFGNDPSVLPGNSEQAQAGMFRVSNKYQTVGDGHVRQLAADVVLGSHRPIVEIDHGKSSASVGDDSGCFVELGDGDRATKLRSVEWQRLQLSSGRC